jgi:hypothetical protein
MVRVEEIGAHIVERSHHNDLWHPYGLKCWTDRHSAS